MTSPKKCSLRSKSENTVQNERRKNPAFLSHFELKPQNLRHLPISFSSKISNSTKIVMCFIFLCVFCVILFHPSLFFVNPPLKSSSSNYSFLHIFFIYFITFEERNNERETFIRTSFMMMFSFTYSHYYY